MYDMLCIYLHDNGMEPKWPPTVCATFSRVLVALCAPTKRTHNMYIVFILLYCGTAELVVLYIICEVYGLYLVVFFIMRSLWVFVFEKCYFLFVMYS